MKKKILIAGFLLLSHAAFTKDKFFQEYAISVGMANISYTENPVELTSDSTTTQETDSTAAASSSSEAASGAASSMSMDINYKFSPGLERSFYMRGTFPFMNATGNSFFSGGVGVEFYLNSIGSKLGLVSDGTTINMTPKIRYFWGLEAGIGYLVYVTDTKKANDILFEIGGHGGIVYSISKKYGLRAQVSIARGTGAATTTMAMKAVMGLTFYIDE